MRSPSLEPLLNREIDKFRALDNVVGIGVLGSLARGDLWECSDLDLVVLFEKAETDFSLDFDDHDGIPVDIMCITPKYLKEQLYVSALYGCRIIYDPKNLLLSAVDKANAIHFSEEEINKRNHGHIEKAQKSLKKAYRSFECSDFPSTVEHSRQAVLNSGMIVVERSHSIMSHHRRIGKYQSSFQALGCQDIYGKFLECLRMNKIKEKTCKLYEELVRCLFENCYPWVHRKLDEHKAPQWMDWTKKISLLSVLDWRILPIYKKGHRYADFVDKVIDEFEEFANVVFEVNNHAYENAIFVFRDLENFEDKPHHFHQMFRKAVQADNLTYERTQRIIRDSADFVETVKKL